MMLKPSERIYWLDTCRAIGIFLVFYGHLWLSDKFPNVEIALQNKLIYAFHMPLFFIISGYCWKDKKQEFPIYFQNKARARLIPVILFNILALGLSILRDLFQNQIIPIKTYLRKLLLLIQGQPAVNYVTWFLVCLFITELIHFFVVKKITRPKDLVITTVIFYIVGFIVTWKINLVANLTGIAPNFWYIHEAVIAYTFFLIGYFIKQNYLLETIANSSKKYLYLLISSLILLVTFDLNQGWDNSKFRLVLMIASLHGHPIWFLVTALAGSLSLIFVSQIIPENKTISFFGQNTLILLGLNGFFRDLINPSIVSLIPSGYLDSHWQIFVVCSLISILSLVSCVPAIMLFNQYRKSQ